MDHIKILKRAFAITSTYRVLWVFGILLALTSARSGGGNNNAGSQVESPNGFPELAPEMVNTLITGAIVLACVILILAVAAAIMRYVSETALIRMVDQHEATGEKLSVRQGFRLGWSRTALRLFLADLLIGVGMAVVLVLLLLIAAAPLLVWLTESTPARVLGSVLAIGMAVLIVGAAIIAAIVLSLLKQFFQRAIVLENTGVIEGIRRGWQLVRQRPGDVLIMGLILLAMNLAWALLMIPVVILLVVVGVVLGGLPGLLVGTIVSLFAQEPTPWIVAAIVGFPIFFLVLAAPLLFLNGLAQTFQSSTWTLTYRELLAPAAEQPAEAG